MAKRVCPRREEDDKLRGRPGEMRMSVNETANLSLYTQNYRNRPSSRRDSITSPKQRDWSIPSPLAYTPPLLPMSKSHPMPSIIIDDIKLPPVAPQNPAPRRVNDHIEISR
jgi:hypothetical protein